MYGKHFEAMYTGSMVGIGAVCYAVWGYVISHQKPPLFDVELNPVILATIIGEPEAEIVKAIQRFCEPDPKSRSKAEEGRKLLKQGEYLYHVVNGKEYDQIRNNEERREYWRTQKLKKRLEVKNGAATHRKTEAKLSPTAQSIKDQTALKRVEERIKVLNGQLPLPENDRRKKELSELKTERDRLKTALDFKA